MKRFPALLLAASLLSSCAQHDGREVGLIESNLNAEQRRMRLTQIRDAAAAAGLENGVLLAGIAQAETGLAHCWSEATWACEGPASDDCGGGGVIAGAADGPCSDMQGGLGMFQFDAGTYEQTLAREGTRILSIAGNVEAAIDFVVSMVIRSVYIEGVDTREQAIAWMNTVRVGGENETEWIQTVTHYYNGCVPGRCSVYDSRIASYTRALHTVWDEMGPEFWMMGMAPPCEPIPAAGRVIDDTDACVYLGGDRRYWRTATDAGYGGSLRWTNATASAAPANFAVWSLRFEESGDYELLVHTDLAYAESRRAPYTITSSAGAMALTVDQTEAAVQLLGVFSFAADADYEVRVDDNSGEPVSEMLAIVADALEVRPIAPALPDGGLPNDEDGGLGGDGGVGGDAGGYVAPPSGRRPSADCSCRAVGGSDGSGALPMALGALALGTAMARRRRR